MILLLPFLLPIAAGPLVFFLGKKTPRAEKPLYGAVLVFVLGVAAYLFAHSTPQTLVLPGAYPLSFKLDGFRAIQVLLAALLWGLSALFAQGYFSKTKTENLSRYRAFDLVTLGGVAGVFLSNNLFTLFIFFEIMSFASYGWVIHRQNEAGRRAGQSYLAASVISGMVMLMGLFLLGNTLGTLELDGIRTAAAAALPGSLYLPGALILVGFGTKAAMYPLHFWLPKAYPAAPEPATALLSGTLSKAGVFGIILLGTNAFLYDRTWGAVILVLGAVTMLWGGLCALGAGDMKRILSFSSMSQIGFILVGIGMQGLLGHENALAVRGTLLHMVNHSLVKLVLFTLCGVVFMQLGSCKLADIRGYGRKNPVFSAAFVVAALGLGGVPFFSGYVSKTLLHESIVEYTAQVSGAAALVMTGLEWVFLLSGGLTVAYLLKIAGTLFAQNPQMEKVEKKLTVPAAIALLVPAALIPALGFVPNLTADALADMGQGLMLGRSPETPVAYFSIVNISGALISLIIGAVLYLGLRRFGKKALYKSLPPEKLDLETLIYRPLICGLLMKIVQGVSLVMDRYILQSLYRVLMFVISWYGRITAGITDWLVELLVLFGFRPAKERPLDRARVPVAYRFGRALDRTAAFLSKKPHCGGSYAESFAKFEQQSAVRRRMIAGSLSYGLFFAGIGLVIVLIYLLLK